MTFAASVFSATVEAVVRVDAFLRDVHFGLDAGALLDAAAAEVAPVGREVLADGDVERAAVGQRLLLLEDALAESVRADDGRAAVVLQSGGHDLRRRGGVLIDEHDHRHRTSEIAPPVATSICVGCVRPRVVTIVPLGMKMLAISCASSTSPPPLPRRSSTMPWAPSCSWSSTASRTSACAPGLKVASATIPSLTPWTVLVTDSTTGSDTTARVILTVLVVPWPGCP